MPIQTYRPSISKTLAYGNLINKDWPGNRGLVARWLALPLLKGRPKLIDIAGNYDGTFTGYGSDSPWRGAMGRMGGFGSVNFDGTDDYVIRSSVSFSLPMTLSVWFNVADLSGIREAVYLGNGGASAGWCSIEVTTSGAVSAYYNSNNDQNRFATTAATVSAGVWNHAVAVFSDTNSRTIYLNGSNKVTDSTSAADATLNSWVLGLLRPSAPLRYWAGKLDDACLFNRVLSDSEVYALYDDSRRGYPNSLNRLSGTKYFVGGGGTPAYTATIAASVGAVAASASATFIKPTYTAAISGTTGPSSAVVAASFAKPTYTATVAAAAAATLAQVVATFSKPTYTATVTAATGPVMAAILATFAKPTYTATILATSPAATASALVTFSADAYVATIVAVAAPATAQAYVTFTVSVPPGRFIVDQVSFSYPVDSVEFSYPVDSVTF